MNKVYFKDILLIIYYYYGLTFGARFSEVARYVNPSMFICSAYYIDTDSCK